MGERNGQRALFVCGQPEEGKEERGTPAHQRAHNACSHQKGGGEPSLRSMLFPRAARGWSRTPLPGSGIPQCVSKGHRRGGGTPHTAARASPM